MKITEYYQGRPFRLWMGDIHSIIISDPETIREIFVKHCDNFINRIEMPSISVVSSDYLSLSASSQPHWEKVKHVMIQAFTQLYKTKAKEISVVKVEKFIHVLKLYTKSGECFTPRRYCQTFVINIMLKFVVGKSINYTEVREDRELLDRLIKPMEDVFTHLGGHHLGDFVSFLQPLYLFYLENFNDPAADLKKYIDEEILKHQKTYDPDNHRDVLDLLLSNLDHVNGDLKTIRALLQDFLNSGTETTSTTLEWFFLAMANNPDVQEKAYQELVKIADKETMLITYCQRQYTPYTNALIKEVMRKYPVLPIGLLRNCSNDITINGTHIPKDTIVFQNLHYLFKSDRYWDQPNEFKPERFLEDNHSDIFHPFGVGPRLCVGQSLANDILYMGIANVLLNFKIQSINAKQVDETELFTLTVHPNLFQVSLKSRLY
ncbi:hypothetical protein CYY_006715 [Polysphondylium violaceum]|uniref:Cytochrome P450 family protein n=1 Tax=Polysphondylium violaceum TaxID=133409 RepID=A0A8J4PQY4_9MYCE|nr:hypothetical protein CYY_006715 [Polysphondylium violaceum]